MPDFKLIKPKGLTSHTNAAAYSLAKEEPEDEVTTHKSNRTPTEGAQAQGTPQA
jgi:hypothetical protein